jgi:hypothetical protein
MLLLKKTFPHDLRQFTSYTTSPHPALATESSSSSSFSSSSPGTKSTSYSVNAVTRKNNKNKYGNEGVAGRGKDVRKAIEGRAFSSGIQGIQGMDSYASMMGEEEEEEEEEEGIPYRRRRVLDTTSLNLSSNNHLHHHSYHKHGFSDRDMLKITELNKLDIDLYQHATVHACVNKDIYIYREREIKVL